MKILYEDNHILVLDKPPLIPTQATEGHSTSLEEEAKAFIKKRDAKKGGVFLHAVHRLDRATSGIVLFAKTQKALERLTQSLRERACRKEYLAVVEGSPPLGDMKDFLLHGDHKALVVSQETPGAKEAILSISSATPITLPGIEHPHLYLVRIVLHTGRYHQIRAQLAHHGFPIVGDQKYGSSLFLPYGIALHHTQFTFSHPIRKENVTISSPSQNF